MSFLQMAIAMPSLAKFVIFEFCARHRFT